MFFNKFFSRSNLELKINDGGRAAAGFKGQAGDCVVRSIAIATGMPYQKVYDDLFKANQEFNTERISGLKYNSDFNTFPSSR